ncbi:hypothetical protein [Chromohalobacter sp. 11-W]|uniref:hypothetical protein n=1 Tax=Chromohalobacter sp. 11-W TaxID=2994061 RepID=UPI00246975A5|nr:hypothetical protein [Chromohalobacter sp. 11-W]
MKRSSIFDRLHQRAQPCESAVETTLRRTDYDPDCLRLIDGVALTAAGLICAGSIPDEHTPELSSSLCGPDGFQLLVHQVADVAPLHAPRLQRCEYKALRVHELIQTLLTEALVMLEALPEDAFFDVIVTSPLKSPEAIDIVLASLRGAIDETRYASVLGALRHEGGGDPHASLTVGNDGGMPYVLWISADSLLNAEDATSLQHHRASGRTAKGAGLCPGEAVASLLIQRCLPEVQDAMAGWCVEKGLTTEHQARSSRRDHAKRQTLLEHLSQAWPLPAESPPTLESGAPSHVVIDAMGLPGRAVEVGSAVIERWPEIDMIEDGVGIDQLCGWPGEALSALSWVLALAPLSPSDSALIIGVAPETVSRTWILRSCAAEHEQVAHHS